MSTRASFDVAAARTRHPGAVLWAHPDAVQRSWTWPTASFDWRLVREAAASAAADVIIATECGMLTVTLTI